MNPADVIRSWHRTGMHLDNVLKVNMMHYACVMTLSFSSQILISLSRGSLLVPFAIAEFNFNLPVQKCQDLITARMYVIMYHTAISCSTLS